MRKPIKFRSKNKMVVPYIELFKNASEPLPITSIVVGPHQFQERQTEAVKMILEAELWDDVEVRASAIPYQE
jgi:hypothetical protein